MDKLKAVMLSLLFLLLPVLLTPASAQAQFNPLDGACLDENGNRRPKLNDSEVCNESDTTEDPITGTEGVVLRVANLLAFLAGVIAVIIIIVAGITMILSGGNPDKVKNSRNAIIYALVGAIVVVLSRSIVVFIINRTG